MVGRVLVRVADHRGVIGVARPMTTITARLAWREMRK
jgi:hypothetical protein